MKTLSYTDRTDCKRSTTFSGNALFIQFCREGLASLEQDNSVCMILEPGDATEYVIVFAFLEGSSMMISLPDFGIVALVGHCQCSPDYLSEKFKGNVNTWTLQVIAEITRQMFGDVGTLKYKYFDFDEVKPLTRSGIAV